MVVYGFRAMYVRLKQTSSLLPSDLIRLETSDWDILVSVEEFNSLLRSIPPEEIISMRPIRGYRYFIKTRQGNYDIHIIMPEHQSSNKILLETFNEGRQIEDHYGNRYYVPDMHTLFEIKKSHRFIRKSFFKTMEDYYRLQRLVYSEDESEFYKLRFKETMERGIKNTRHINLKQDKDDFFDTKGVTYIYDHDSIHRAIALTSKPMYLYYLEDGQDVICSKAKWDKLLLEHKRYAVLEEAYVIALERFITRTASTKTDHQAFVTALEKICTTLCKGWFREFAYENYLTILTMYSPEFVTKFYEAYNNGEILPYKGK